VTSGFLTNKTIEMWKVDSANLSSSKSKLGFIKFLVHSPHRNPHGLHKPIGIRKRTRIKEHKKRKKKVSEIQILT